MTDFGTTGIQVAPKAPTEDDMRTVQGIIQRAIDALVGMSQLQHDVETLRTTVNELQQSTDHYRNTIAAQDETINFLRGERDRANSNASDYLRRAVNAENDRTNLEQRNADLQATLESLRQEHEAVKSDRDTHALRSMDLEDQLKSAHSKLDAVREGFETIFGKPMPEAVQASAEPVSVPITEQAPSTPPSPEVPWWEKPAVAGGV